MTEWLYEEGIGENRAMLIDKGRVKKIRIERNFGDYSGPKCGAILRAKLIKKYGNGGFISFEDGDFGDSSEAVIKKWPTQTEGQSINVEIIREPIWERTRVKPAIALASDRELQNGPTLFNAITSSQIHVKKCLPHEGDIFAQHGWYEILDQAVQGIYGFSGGELIIDEVAAMTVMDVDGDGSALSLSKSAAKASAHAIDVFDLQGMIGIDFPSLESKNDRTQALVCFDDAMEIPCERTSINGFGFMQVVVKRRRPSIISMMQRDRDMNAALLALRRAEYECAQYSNLNSHPTMQITAHPNIINHLKRYDWLEMLMKRTGHNWQLSENDQYIAAQTDISSIPIES